MEPRAELLKSAFSLGQGLFQAVVGDLDETMAAHVLPGGMVASGAAIMAHVIYGQDRMVANARGGETLLESNGFGTKTGILSPGPSMTPEWVALEFNVAGLKEYAQVVFAQTIAFLEAATAADLDRQVPTPFGTEASAAELLVGAGIVHLAEHTGELSVLKGAQGLRGLPF